MIIVLCSHLNGRSIPHVAAVKKKKRGGGVGRDGSRNTQKLAWMKWITGPQGLWFISREMFSAQGIGSTVPIQLTSYQVWAAVMYACCWLKFKEELCKAMNLQVALFLKLTQRVDLGTNKVLGFGFFIITIIVCHPNCVACSMHSVDLIKHATHKLSSKHCDQIKAQQPYPQIHQGLIPFQTKLHSPFPYPLWKAQWLEVDLKSTIAPPPCLTPPYSRWDLLESPKPRPVYQHQGIRQSLPPFSNGEPNVFGSPRCNLFGCRQIQWGVSCDNRITQVETGEGGTKERDRG